MCWAFNTDILNHNTHNYTRRFLDYIYSFGLYTLITKPSIITDICVTLIDTILTNELQFQLNSLLLITDVSDRFLLFAVISLYVVLQLIHYKEEL